LHVTPLGSGSHSPLFVQFAELEPLRTNPDGQLKETVLPSAKNLSWVSINGIEPFTFEDSSGCPHNNCIIIMHNNDD
jgi:hypothetical protein